MKVKKNDQVEKNWPAEVLAEEKGNVGWVTEEIIVNISYDHRSSYRNKNCNCQEYLLLSLVRIYLCVFVYVYLCVCVCVQDHTFLYI